MSFCPKSDGSPVLDRAIAGLWVHPRTRGSQRPLPGVVPGAESRAGRGNHCVDTVKYMWSTLRLPIPKR